MITEQSRKEWIGGSDAIRLYGDFGTATFLDWWEERKHGNRSLSLDNKHIWSGNILEQYVLQYLNIPENQWNVQITLKDSIAGVNTDAFDGHTIMEVKTILWDHLYKYVNGNMVTKAYRAQILHGMVVTNAWEAAVYMLGMSDKEKAWPFSVIPEISKRLWVKKFHVSDFIDENFNPENHLGRIKYLDKCFARGVQPTNDGLNQFLNNISNKVQNERQSRPQAAGHPEDRRGRNQETGDALLRI